MDRRDGAVARWWGGRVSEDAQVILETPTEAVIRDELHRLVLADLHGPLGWGD